MSAACVLLLLLSASHVQGLINVKRMVDRLFKMIPSFPSVIGKMDREDPEVNMNVFEIIKYHGYSSEEYDVTTEDGYILTIHRIPYGKSGPGDKLRRPVIVQHGFICSSAIWVVNTPDKNLGYILADAGYDVWLTNIRGNDYGYKHVYLTPKDKEFWNFSFEEMAQYDMPAIIDFILQMTNFGEVYYIGHSMGTTISMAMLSSRPEYATKVRGVIALAPVATLTHSTTPLLLLEPLAEGIKFGMGFFGRHAFEAKDTIARKLTDGFCSSPIKEICSNLLFVIAGFDSGQLNKTRLPVFVQHVPAGTSVKTAQHFIQIYRADNFQHFDYGPKGNLAKYGQRDPLPYDVTKITTPYALFWSDNDILADPEDVHELIPKLKNLVMTYHVPLPSFNHIDFMWATDGKPLVYDKVLEVLNTM